MEWPADDVLRAGRGLREFAARRRGPMRRTTHGSATSSRVRTRHARPRARHRGRSPDDGAGACRITRLKAVAKEAGATHAPRRRSPDRAAELVPSLVGGAADLNNSTKTDIPKAGDIEKPSFAGRNFHFGVREHAMGGPLGSGAARGLLAARLHVPGVLRLHAAVDPARVADGAQVFYVFTHDSIFVGEDGPTHEPIEQLAALRAVPNLIVLRPSDAAETVEAWRVALTHSDGTVGIVLTRQKVPVIDRKRYASTSGLAQGAYVLADADGSAPSR